MDESQTQLTVTDEELRRVAIIQIVVDELARGKTIKDACEKAGITPRTWRNWRSSGYVQEVLNTRYADIVDGTKEVIASSMVKHVDILAKLAQGVVPRNTAISGNLLASDVIAAGKQLFSVWKAVGGDRQQDAHDQQLLDQLKGTQLSITQVHVQTMNIGSSDQPMPVPIGVDDIVEGEVE